MVVAAVAKGAAAAAGKVVVAPLVVVEAKAAAAEAGKATARLVAGQAQPAVLLAAAEAMRRPRRSHIQAWAL